MYFKTNKLGRRPRVGKLSYQQEYLFFKNLYCHQSIKTYYTKSDFAKTIANLRKHKGFGNGNESLGLNFFFQYIRNG